MDTKAAEMSVDYDVFKQAWEDYMDLLAWVRANFPCFVEQWRCEHGPGSKTSACVIALLQMLDPMGVMQKTCVSDVPTATFY
jgi:hypothetical protein